MYDYDFTINSKNRVVVMILVNENFANLIARLCSTKLQRKKMLSDNFIECILMAAPSDALSAHYYVI